MLLSWLKERKERYDALLIGFRTLCYAIAQERFWGAFETKVQGDHLGMYLKETPGSNKY